MDDQGQNNQGAVNPQETQKLQQLEQELEQIEEKIEAQGSPATNPVPEPKVTAPLPNTPIQTPPPIQPAPPPKPKGKSNIVFTIAIMLLVISVLTAIVYFFLTNKPISLKPKPTQSPVIAPTSNPTVERWLYTNDDWGFSVEIPSWLDLLDESEEEINFSYGVDKYIILTFTKDLTDFENIELCGDPNDSPGGYKETCVSSWETESVESAITKTKLGKVPVQLLGSVWVDGWEIVYQTLEDPEIEIRIKRTMMINDLIDGLEQTFSLMNEAKIGERVNCPALRPEVCTMECISPPPYICGSNGQSYCTPCQACADSGVDWYVSQNESCSTTSATLGE